MNDDKITELLSAYLDGESGDPEAVERLIGGDPAVRRRFEVLQAQSRALRALPPPEVSPAFAARVLAGARQERFRPQRGWVALAAPWVCALELDGPLVQGGVVMGIGQALTEGSTYDENGRQRSPALLEYKLQTAADAPPIDIHFVQINTPIFTIVDYAEVSQPTKDIATVPGLAIKKILEQIVLEYKERLELVGYNDLILMETNQAIVLTVSQNNVIKIFTEGIISEPPPKDHMYIGVVDDKVLKSWTDTPNFEGYVFDIKNRRIYSDSGFSDLLEDFRNFLRRRGLRFDTDDFYKSISLRDKISLKKIVGNTEG